ncbi:MAG: PilZ domain-containing protein [Candidatus Omnitrophica bacterium]|nr:PilZ domain-containing protein [Candidatus Omnitrophota bacterium]MDE2008908.1 PilZ domain-containing protein [Candidatus Omnitrophota bacterium]MDE2213529.1 PilZ domain-containing protein [Candidatus Omnitrophota bacterium]MDE2230570.1 PilZ domain-containing protein [Candidatus Omnitrophota bacterium]
MFENRRHFRLREFLDVSWKVADQNVSGEGTVVNISASGLLLQTDKVFKPSDNCVLSIESGTEALPFAAKKGKIMWFQRIGASPQRFLCGIQFLADKPDGSLQRWLEVKINQLCEAGDAKILGNLAL